jgi:H+/Cl- antiporter ClcA
LVIAGLLGTATGGCVALFLWLLQMVTMVFWQFPHLLYLLPVAGLISGLLYQWAGHGVERGNRLIFEQIRNPDGLVPLRMAPLVLAGTLLTHLCGGSAGREGTAVQIGGSLAGGLGRWLRFSGARQQTLLQSGLAGGFGAVFGTPLAGIVYAFEAPQTDRWRLQALGPCVVAAMLGHLTATACGTTHATCSIADITNTSASAWLQMHGLLLLAGVAFVLTGRLYVKASDNVGRVLNHWIRGSWLRPVCGGLLLVLLVSITGQTEALGLGADCNPWQPQATSLATVFNPGGSGWLSWWWKLIFTALTVGSGLRGGEVTPLFYIGATLGHSLSRLLRLPVDLLSGLGFVTVFGAALRVPVTSLVLGLELFGWRDVELWTGLIVMQVAQRVSAGWRRKQQRRGF